MLPSYHHVDALSILETHLFLWISTSGAVFLDQPALPEPDGALEVRGESPLAPGIPHGRRHRVCVDAKPAAICVTSPYARSYRGQAAARTRSLTHEIPSENRRVSESQNHLHGKGCTNFRLLFA